MPEAVDEPERDTETVPETVAELDGDPENDGDRESRGDADRERVPEPVRETVGEFERDMVTDTEPVFDFETAGESDRDPLGDGVALLDANAEPLTAGLADALRLRWGDGVKDGDGVVDDDCDGLSVTDTDAVNDSDERALEDCACDGEDVDSRDAVITEVTDTEDDELLLGRSLLLVEGDAVAARGEGVDGADGESPRDRVNVASELRLTRALADTPMEPVAPTLAPTLALRPVGKGVALSVRDNVCVNVAMDAFADLVVDAELVMVADALRLCVRVIQSADGEGDADTRRGAAPEAASSASNPAVRRVRNGSGVAGAGGNAGTGVGGDGGAAVARAHTPLAAAVAADDHALALTRLATAAGTCAASIGNAPRPQPTDAGTVHERAADGRTRGAADHASDAPVGEKMRDTEGFDGTSKTVFEVAGNSVRLKTPPTIVAYEFAPVSVDVTGAALDAVTRNASQNEDSPVGVEPSVAARNPSGSPVLSVTLSVNFVSPGSMTPRATTPAASV